MAFGAQTDFKMIITLLILLAADVSYGMHSPIAERVCDDMAYLLIEVPPLPVLPIIVPDYLSQWKVNFLLQDFIHAYPTNRPLPNAGRASETYQESFEQWKRDRMRRRNQ